MIVLSRPGSDPGCNIFSAQFDAMIILQPFTCFEDEITIIICLKGRRQETHFRNQTQPMDKI